MRRIEVTSRLRCRSRLVIRGEQAANRRIKSQIKAARGAHHRRPASRRVRQDIIMIELRGIRKRGRVPGNAARDLVASGAIAGIDRGAAKRIQARRTARSAISPGHPSPRVGLPFAFSGAPVASNVSRPPGMTYAERCQESDRVLSHPATETCVDHCVICKKALGDERVLDDCEFLPYTLVSRAD